MRVEWGRTPAAALAPVAPQVERPVQRKRALRSDPGTPPADRVAVAIHSELGGPGIVSSDIVAAKSDRAVAVGTKFGCTGPVILSFASR